LNFIADSDATTTENALVWVSLEKRRAIIRRESHSLPWIERLFHSIFINKCLECTFAFLFAPWTDHGMVKEDELELELSRF
jgi:hypothetical protein